MDKNRHAAIMALDEIIRNGAYSNIALNRIIEREKPDAPSFVRELVYGVLENKLYIDYILQGMVNTPLAKIDKITSQILRAGIYQIAFMNSVPDYAAVNESVALSKKLEKGKDKFVNACLRRYLRERDSIRLPDREKDLIGYLSVRYSYHPSIIRMWLKNWQGDEKIVEALLASGNQTPELTIRVNTLKTSKEALKEALTAEGFTCEDGLMAAECIRISPGMGASFRADTNSGADAKSSGGMDRQITHTSAFREGLFYIQDESSMMAVLMLDPRPGELIVDVCAAPGGKSVFIAERMQNQGRVIAGDISERKLKLLEDTAVRHGVSIIESRTVDARKPKEDMISKADRVLVDAPCSGLGVIRRRPEIKYKDYNEEFSKLPLVQQEILQASSMMVKPGGLLVYSTCTISDAENFEVIQRFLQKNPDFTIQKENILQILPQVHGMDGFCVFKMVKSK